MIENSPIVLSICIPTFNRCRYLEQLFHEISTSIYKLGFNYEILVGDNSSIDETEEICNRFSSTLNIKYLRRNSNIGAAANLRDLYQRASGIYVMYLADDDLPIFDAISDAIVLLARNIEIGCVFAPWILYDKVSGEDTALFYRISQEQIIQRRDFPTLLAFLISHHIFPEIFIIRREIIYKSLMIDIDEGYWAFVLATGILQESAVIFSPRPFYRFVTRYFPDESRINAGNEDAKWRWDCYRGGLEFMLAKFSSLLPSEQIERWNISIGQFVHERMCVAIRLRTMAGDSWISSYVLANRIISHSESARLPAPYFLYRLNAAYEHLMRLGDPHRGGYRLAYFKNAPLEILIHAHGFSISTFQVLLDKTENSTLNLLIVLPESYQHSTVEIQQRTRYIRETELLELFP